MKKILLVLAVLALGTLASAQTFSFWSASGAQQYCNFNVITYNSGGVVAGYDDVVDACYYPINSPIVGFNATTPNLGLPAFGKGVVVGDGIYDASEETYSGEQWTVWQSLTYSKHNKKTGAFTGKYCWVGVAGSYYGTYYGDNYGYCTATAPVKTEVSGHGTTAGKIPSALKK